MCLLLLFCVCTSANLYFVGALVIMHRPHAIRTLRNLYFVGVCMHRPHDICTLGNLYFAGVCMLRPHGIHTLRNLYFAGVCMRRVHDIRTLRNLYFAGAVMFCSCDSILALDESIFLEAGEGMLKFWILDESICNMCGYSLNTCTFVLHRCTCRGV